MNIYESGIVINVDGSFKQVCSHSTPSTFSVTGIFGLGVDWLEVSEAEYEKIYG
jgi:hypothetical protein